MVPMSEQDVGAIERLRSYVDWVLVVFGPVLVALAWDFGWISFEWAVITLLLYSYYLQGVLHDFR